MALPVLTRGDLSNVELSSKIESAEVQFFMKFNCRPTFFVKCPGRVNLIGEHLDYNSFGVLPIAIDCYSLIAVSPSTDGRINIFNYDKKYQPISLSYSDLPDKADQKHFHWASYVFAGISVVAKNFNLDPEMNILVMGDIPIAAGLSSSSALVCGAAIATVHQYGLNRTENLGKKELAELCAIGERYVGTRGGGMDHAIIMFGQKGYASAITFFPELKVTNIRLPRGIKFIVAHSGVKYEKATTKTFNKRVAECILAVKVFAHKSGYDWRNVSNLWELLDCSHWHYIHDMADDFKFRPRMWDYYTGECIQRLLHIELEEIEQITGYSPACPRKEKYKLKQRLEHIFTEINNVKRFLRACQVKDVVGMGKAMTDSHKSLMENFRCSHYRLDAMVGYAKQQGAFGARLTGAGWGGCIVAVAPECRANTVEEGLKSFLTYQGVSDPSVFAVSPGEGACIIENKDEGSESVVIDCIVEDKKECSECVVID